MDFLGIIIEESLKKTSVLKKVFILSTKVEKVTKKHKTPWLEKWTLHKIKVPESSARKIAQEISQNLESGHNWYADFKNNQYHFIIFKSRVFKVDRTQRSDYEKAKEYGIKLGIPDYQLTFSEEIIIEEKSLA